MCQREGWEQMQRMLFILLCFARLATKGEEDAPPQLCYIQPLLFLLTSPLPNPPTDGKVTANANLDNI